LSQTSTRRVDRADNNRQDGGDGLPPRRTEDNATVGHGEERSDLAPRQGGEHGRGGGPGRAGRMNTISEEPPLTGHDQGQDTANTAETTPSRLERRAAEIRDFNRRRRAHGHTNSDTSGNTPYTQGVGRPLERTESSLDPSMNRARSNAICPGFAPRPEDVERHRANLERRAWIAAGRALGRWKRGRGTGSTGTRQLINFGLMRDSLPTARGRGVYMLEDTPSHM